MTGSEAKKRLEKQYKNQNEWIKSNYDRISVAVPAGTKDRIKKAGYSVNGLVNKLLIDFLDQEEKKI